MKIAGVVLAGGGSRRMGGQRNKCLLLHEGEPLVAHVARLSLTACASSVVVTGFDADAVHDALSPFAHNLRLVHNPDWRTGQASSLRVGLAALPSTVAGAAVFLADQPCVRPETVDRLLHAFHKRPHDFVAPQRKGRRGNPVVIPAGRFPEVMALTGDTGARPLFERYGVHVVNIDDPGVVMDVDTVEDYARLCAQSSAMNQP